MLNIELCGEHYIKKGCEVYRRASFGAITVEIVVFHCEVFISDLFIEININLKMKYQRRLVHYPSLLYAFSSSAFLLYFKLQFIVLNVFRTAKCNCEANWSQVKLITA